MNVKYIRISENKLISKLGFYVLKSIFVEVENSKFFNFFLIVLTIIRFSMIIGIMIFHR